MIQGNLCVGDVMRIGPLGIVPCTWQSGQVDQQHPKQQQQQPYEQQLKHQHQRLRENDSKSHAAHAKLRQQQQ